jgi:hypothetical protein
VCLKWWQGSTPVISVFYNGESNFEPMVQYALIRTYSLAGEKLPNQLNYHTSGTAAKGVGYAGFALVVVYLVRMPL